MEIWKYGNMDLWIIFLKNPYFQEIRIKNETKCFRETDIVMQKLN